MVETIYAAWLGKIIGVRYGAQVENWHHDQIQDAYGSLSTYPHGFAPYFAADDDLNGPYYFTQILDRFPKGDFSPYDFGEYLLECICDHRGFFWWGGVDVSSEERGYTNLKNGIPSPQSGSVETNGRMLANQIGGQIFIDGWGYVAMHDPDKAMELAGKCACAMHDQNGIEGAKFVAGCIAYAPLAENMESLVSTIRNKLDDTYDYGKAIDLVMDLYHRYPHDPNHVLSYLLQHHGYDHYEGACHIIPNSMLMIYALLYGKGDFSKTIRLCNNAGYDTDCNVGNVGSIMGAYVGLDGIDPFWIEPLNDMLIASGANGYANRTSIAQSALWFYHAHCRLYGKDDPVASLLNPHHLGFDLPYQTHGITTDFARYHATSFINHDGCAHFVLMDVNPNTTVRWFYPSLILPADLYDARYNPQMTSHIYPGETIRVKLGKLPQGIKGIGLYYQDVEGVNHDQPMVKPQDDLVLTMTIQTDCKLIHGIGMMVETTDRQLGTSIPIYSIDISKTPTYIQTFDVSSTLDYGLDFGLVPHLGIMDWIIQHGDASIRENRLHLNGQTTITSGDPYAQLFLFSMEFYTKDPYDFLIAWAHPTHGFTHKIAISSDGLTIFTPDGFTHMQHEFTHSFKNIMVIRPCDDKMELVLNDHAVPLDFSFPSGRIALTVNASSLDICSIGINMIVQS